MLRKTADLWDLMPDPTSPEEVAEAVKAYTTLLTGLQPLAEALAPALRTLLQPLTDELLDMSVDNRLRMIARIRDKVPHLNFDEAGWLASDIANNALATIKSLGAR